MAKTYHFKVGNGDMALVELENGRRILIDINIRSAAGNANDDTPDVAAQLREILDRDDDDRLFVDAFLLTHPDADHVRGLQNHFHLGPLSSHKAADDKIVIRTMWSSPLVFRRRRKDDLLSADAEAWKDEARRRVALFRKNKTLGDGDRILVLGEDVDAKTDDLEGILVRAGERFANVDGIEDELFDALLLAPRLAETEDEANILTKNNSSVIIQMRIGAGGKEDAAYLLFGGDAEVVIWEKLWDRWQDEPANLAYDLLVAPHHCSWHSLSCDSWSEKGEEAEVSPDARSALAQGRPGAMIVASSCPISDDDKDPPCIRAKREYEDMAGGFSGEFKCVGEVEGDDPVMFEIGRNGPKLKRVALAATTAAATGVGSEALAHG